MNWKTKLAKGICTCGGLGLFPLGPGTFTSIFAALFWVTLRSLGLSVLLIGILIVLLTLLGVLATQVYERAVGGEDLSEVTIDEWIGVGIGLLPVFILTSVAWTEPLSFRRDDALGWPVLAAFAFFRLFDITKPMGVRYFDRNYLQGWGVMLDDVVAGLYSAGCVWILLWLIQ